MEQSQPEKWEGKVSAKLLTTNADDAWSLLSDFCSLHRWLPGVDTCHLVSGVEGQPGCVRYCARDDDGGFTVVWANEELLAFDSVDRSYCYRIKENNMGFGWYVATLKVSSSSDEKDGGAGCELEWSFESESVAGWSEEGLVALLQAGVEAMAKRVEQALRKATVPASSLAAINIINE